MAASGSQTIQLYYSTSSGAAPVAGNLASGELAININDGKLYYKDSGGTVQTLATKGTAAIGGSNTQVQYNNSGALAGSGNLTFDGTTLTAGGLSGPLNGSVGATTPSTGAFTNLSSSGTVSGTGFSTYLASPPAIGGTTPAAGSFTTLSASGNITVSGGTANGVVYLNGSKVATSGSALTYNGTTLTAVNNASAVSIGLSRTSATARDYALGIDGDGGFRLTDSTGSVVILSCMPSVSFLAAQGELYFKANNTEGMRLTSTGLGIGTSSPQARLHINSGAGSTQFRMGPNSTSSDRALINYNSTTNRFVIDMSGNDAVVVDGSGNLGLGVTPSAWTRKAFQIGDAAAAYVANNSGGNINLVANTYFDGSNKYATSAGASRYSVDPGGHIWYTAASGTAGNTITFTQAMTLDASGNLGVGTTGPFTKLDVRGTSNTAGSTIQITGNTVSSLLLGQNADGGVIRGQGGNNALTFWTGGSGDTGAGLSGTERARIDSSGRLGLGITPTGSWSMQIYGIGSAASGSARIRLQNSSTGSADADGGGIGMEGVDLVIQNSENGVCKWEINGSERARIDSSGNLLVGSSTTAVSSARLMSYFNGNTNNGIQVHDTYTSTGTNNAIYFTRNASAVGSITTTTTTTAYNTSSDYRLKNIAGALTGSGKFIDALKPKVGTWKADGSKFVGFLAHEVQEVSPGSVVGTKDAVDEEGKPIMQAMEYGSAEFIANIVAELQSLRKRVAELEAK